MLSLIHGDNIVKSRDRLHAYRTRAKDKNIKDIIDTDGKKLDLNCLMQQVETQSFFSSPKLLIIENLFKHPSKRTQKELFTYLNTNPVPGSTHIVFWEPKTLTASQIKKLPRTTKIEMYTTSAVVFTFLDSLRPGAAKIFFPLFAQSCQKDSAEFVFFMLIRQVRQLFLSADSTSKLPPWQKSKLIKQFKYFGQEKLILFHDTLTDLDWRQKSGRLVGSFQSELEKILITM
jgi:hypothetical protein